MTQTLATQSDAVHLERTLELAERGRGRTSPNPLVGAVVVRDGHAIGEGHHAGPGCPHAEPAALADCFEDPDGATLYVSLEPCAHRGRTPPCVEAILAAGIRRVVVASDDPSAKASGRGPELLRAEGVEVEWAEARLAHAARLLNQPFRKHARTGRPLVVLKSALTLDGKVATRAGDSRWISSEASRARVHALRAEVDAVAIGIGTALADDPQLTARPGDGEPIGQPWRVVFDSHARLPLDSVLVRSAGGVPVLVVCSPDAPISARDALAAAGVEVLVVEGDDETARVAQALSELGERGIQSLVLEGGPRLAGAFLDAGEIDAMLAFIAPVLAGGGEARSVLEGRGVEAIADARRAVSVEVEPIGDDTCIHARFREW
ncbi:MAG: Diaminohydroxyphosphoribosylaminopyrimidine deaminase / 5-amino-6-(5-phosphoribosylamino)uracil reductase [uncultured Solirubrobacterales bacterium]|uniref:Riboflavin biosynthesis protein RibD n=1 Tax=uncultured Solirubrobacterales bacterium TaxID=768556 RepID=A0A6J4T5D4_9ACTN|nr:MAG: Diaminohydroxyphosphoribosylaminopyrimidine deaminase / 5-amino-6-(5-phosphoribosylamino)uracil reductase [uncultured Solirubrobacterales bacterium]